MNMQLYENLNTDMEWASSSFWDISCNYGKFFFMYLFAQYVYNVMGYSATTYHIPRLFSFKYIFTRLKDF